MTTTGGDLLLDLLEGYGIEYIFCSPGTEWAAVWEGLLKRQGKTCLRYVNCRHEMLAVSMAQGYAEASGGRMAAVLLHSGVGALSGAMAIRTAYFARASMLIMSGETYEHAGGPELRPQGFHWLALLSDIGGPSAMVKSYVKWSNSIRSRDGLIDLVGRGCQIARAPTPGPVFLTVAPELLARPLAPLPVACPRSTPIKLELPLDGINEAAALLARSHHPVVLTEHAGKNPAAITRLIQLAETLNAPVFEFFPFFGNFPKDHPLYQGYDALPAIQEADVVFIAGSTIPWYPPAACLRPDVTVILLDDDSLHQNIPQWGYHVDLSLTADIEQGLFALLEAIRIRLDEAAQVAARRHDRLPGWQAKHARMWQEREADALAGQKNKPVAAPWLFHELSRLAPDNTMFVDETISHTRNAHRYLGHPARYFRPTYGGLGVGMGEAIGVKLAQPDKTVALVIGDGSFNYNPALAAFGLCQEYHLPMLIVITNNGGYQAMKMGHTNLFPQGTAVSRQEFLGVNISPAPDYIKLAEAFGAAGKKVEDPALIEEAIQWGFQRVENGQAVLLDVIM